MNLRFCGEKKLAEQLLAETRMRGFAAEFAAAADAAADENLGAMIFGASSETDAMPDHAELRAIFEQLKSRQISTAIAFADFPRRAENWLMYWAMILPFIDFFAISYAAAVKMFEPEQFADTRALPNAELCAAVSGSIINLGAAAALFTFSGGLYLRTSSIGARLRACGKSAAIDDETWRTREIFAMRRGGFAPLVGSFFAAIKSRESPEKNFAAPAEATADFANEFPALMPCRELAVNLRAGIYDKIER